MSLQTPNEIIVLIISIQAETLKIIQNVLKQCRNTDQILKKKRRKNLIKIIISL